MATATTKQMSIDELRKALLHLATNGVHKDPKPLDASNIKITPAAELKPVPEWNSLAYFTQKYFTDHMLTCQWTDAEGWEQPEIQPFGTIPVHPSASAFHYATECFEGLKFYRGYDGKLRLFRPELNTKRMRMSAERVCLPTLDDAEVLKLIKALCKYEGKRWLPVDKPGQYVYIRPVIFANDETLGVGRPKKVMLSIIMALMPPWDEVIRGGMKLLASEEHTVRAWPGGFGYAKLGANYGPTFVAQEDAKKKDCMQVLWLLPNKKGGVDVTEAGASNFAVVWKTREGQLQMVTPPVGNGIILDGITRKSVVELARERATELEVQERDLDMQEIADAIKEERMVEAFALGTAYFVCAVSQILYKGEPLHIPMAEGNSGKYVGLFKEWINEITYGKVQHKWGTVVEED